MLMKKYGMKERTKKMKLASKEDEAGKQRGRKREDKRSHTQQYLVRNEKEMAEIMKKDMKRKKMNPLLVLKMPPYRSGRTKTCH